MIIFIESLISACLLLMISPYSRSDSVSTAPCISKMLQRSQDCSNKRVIYYSVEGQAGKWTSGFGSEFNHYHLNAVFDAIFHNRRMVLVDVGWPWEYNCMDEKLKYWACYLKMPCDDSFLPTRFSNPEDLQNQSKVPFHQFTRWSAEYIRRKLEESMSRYHWYGSTLSQKTCSHELKKLGRATFAVADYFYDLNMETTSQISIINSFYGSLLRIPYLSAQIRLGDKKREMGHEAWDFITNMTAVTTQLLSIADNSSGIESIYLSSDDCSYVSELASKEYLGKSHYFIFSSCANPSLNLTSARSKKATVPTSKTQTQALHLLADIEMLRRGKIFTGMMESNIVRMVLRLRGYNHRRSFVPLHDPEQAVFIHPFYE